MSMTMSAISSPSMSVADLAEGQATSTNAQSQNQVLGSVAKLLDVSTTQLQSGLASGKSLQSLASAQGVSSAQLVSTVSQSLQSSNPNLSPSQATTLATQISQSAGGGHHHHGGGGAEGSSPVSSTSATNEVSALLATLGSSPATSAASTSTSTSGTGTALMAQLIGAPSTGASSTSTGPGRLDMML